MIETLDAARRDAMERLATGAANRRSAMHVPAVGTADGDIRIMVLRQFDAADWSLRFHTDSRSPKVAAIAADPAVHVLAYDADAKVQIRMRGRGEILREGPIADSAWDAADNFARRCYLANAPGTSSDVPTSGLPAWAEGEKPANEQLAGARQNFAVLRVVLDRIDWFMLAHEGHRRAIFTGTGANWVAP